MPNHRAALPLSRYFLALPVLAVVTLLAACGPRAEAPAADAADEAGRLSREEIAQSVQSTMDASVDPCQDFYRYACGGWLDNTERPADQARWVRSISQIREANLEALRTLVDELSSSEAELSGAEAQVASFYGSCMAVEETPAPVSALDAYFARIAKVEDVESLFAALGDLHPQGVNALFSIGTEADFKEPTVMTAFLFQGGLGLPERGYYLRDDEGSQTLRQRYQEGMASLFELFGDEPAAAGERAAAVLAFETRMAEVSLSPAEMGDLPSLYHPMQRQGLQELAPALAWGSYFDTTGYDGIDDLVVATPDYFKGIEPLVTGGDFADVRSYLRWRVIDAFADYLGGEAEQAHFAVNEQLVEGQEQMEARWKRCLDATDAVLGESLGELFVERRFAGESKQVAEQMIEDIETSFVEALPAVSWMDDETRGRAQGKAEALNDKIGYPDTWRDYSALQLEAGNYLANRVASARLEFAHDMDKAGQPTDRDEWGITPPTVNAYYNPMLNEIVFPAGILQPPMFHRDYPAPMNYGAIGLVMGHELTHGFDDSGRQFDPQGRLAEWWEPEASERYEEQAMCVEKLYDGYEVLPDLTLNGELTLGENIADLGGIKQAFWAWRRWAERNGQPEPLTDSLTNDQLFFVAYGQVWCSLQTDEMVRMRARADSHAHPEYRVVGPLSQFQGFADAFQCAEGTPMNPVEKCEVW